MMMITSMTMRTVIRMIITTTIMIINMITTIRTITTITRRNFPSPLWGGVGVGVGR